MKRVYLLILATVCAAGMSAQERGPLGTFAEALASSDVSFRYAYEVRGDIPMKGNGTAALCGAAYHVTGNGMDLWCDGATRWTVDRNAREAYIESVDKESVDYLSNPATLLGALECAFQVVSVSDVTLGGRKLQAFKLTPSVEETGLDTVVLYLDGSVPARVSILVGDGTETVFRISDYSVKEKSGAVYAFDIASLGTDYVVTDLR